MSAGEAAVGVEGGGEAAQEGDGGSSPEDPDFRIEENFAVFDFELTPEALRRLDSLGV